MAISSGSGRVLTDKGRGRGSSLPPAIAERLARHKAQEQLVFKRKLKHLKCIIRDFVFVSLPTHLLATIIVMILLYSIHD